MSTDLADQACEPCRGGAPAMSSADMEVYLAELDGWSIIDGHHLFKHYPFPNFVSALTFTNTVGELAESVDHHPDILVGWGKAEITLWTHAVDGLHLADFILAARIDRIPRS